VDVVAFAGIIVAVVVDVFDDDDDDDDDDEDDDDAFVVAEGCVVFDTDAANVVVVDDAFAVVEGVVEGIKDCPNRYCLGRSAKSRLDRALQYAHEAGISTPKLVEIQQNFL